MNTSCSVCGKPCQQGNGGKCPKHASADKAVREKARQRPNSARRGYGAGYRSGPGRGGARRGAGEDIRRKARESLKRGETVICIICRKPLKPDDKLTVEHILPIRAGGTNRTPMGPAHARCNYGWRKKRNG